MRQALYRMSGVDITQIDAIGVETALGAYYRRIAQRIGGDIAVFATARKLATLIYRLLRWGQRYVDEGAAAYENRYRQQRIKSLAARAKQLGYQLTPTA
jgi:transposase